MNEIINEKLKQYNVNTFEEEENALKEILQEIALYALSVSHFFSEALFCGGTALRIFYQLPRFSEDLDFTLKKPDPEFNWKRYIDKLAEAFQLFDIQPEIIDRSKMDSVVQKLFLKDNSIGKIIQLKFHHHRHRKLTIKFELDTNPPGGAHDEIKFLDFPQDYAVNVQDLPSTFSGKCHALLCRPYIKGRDWFDFSWYVARNTPINFTMLENAINQIGPWQNQSLKINKAWLLEQLKEKIKSINWKSASQEVEKFLGEKQRESLELWGDAFFLAKLEKLQNYLA